MFINFVVAVVPSVIFGVFGVIVVVSDVVVLRVGVFIVIGAVPPDVIVVVIVPPVIFGVVGAIVVVVVSSHS